MSDSNYYILLPKTERYTMKIIYHVTIVLSSFLLPVAASTPIVSPEFDSLCKTNWQECKTIGTHAKLATDTIYRFFQAERLLDKSKLEEASQEIKSLIGVQEIDIVNRRLPLSQFFPANPNIIFGGYAILAKNSIVIDNKLAKTEYHIIVKGVFNELEDPNDLLAAIKVIPDVLPGKPKVTLHQGMRNYAQEIFLSPQFQNILKEIIRLQAEKTNVEVILSGHSLGGSCILLGALMNDRGVKAENIKMITFGAPLFLQRGFIDRYGHLFQRTTRIEVEGDLLNNEIDSPLFLFYRVLGYLPFGKLIRATIPTATYKQTQAEISRLSLGRLDQENLAKVATLQLDAISERVQIHILSYRSFYDRVLK